MPIWSFKLFTRLVLYWASNSWHIYCFNSESLSRLPWASSLHFWSIKRSSSGIDLDLAGVLLLRFGGKFGVLSSTFRRCRFSLIWLVWVLRLFPIDGINGLLLTKLISSGSCVDDNELFQIFVFCWVYSDHIFCVNICYWFRFRKLQSDKEQKYNSCKLHKYCW